MSSNSAQRLSLSSFQLANLLSHIGLTNEQSANFMTLSGCRTVDNLCWLSEALIKYWVPETCILALYGLRYITMCSKDLSELSDINSDKAILYYQKKNLDMDCIMNSVHHTCLYLNLSFILENVIMRHVPHESNGGPMVILGFTDHPTLIVASAMQTPFALFLSEFSPLAP